MEKVFNISGTEVLLCILRHVITVVFDYLFSVKFEEDRSWFIFYIPLTILQCQRYILRISVCLYPVVLLKNFRTSAHSQCWPISTLQDFMRHELHIIHGGVPKVIAMRPSLIIEGRVLIAVLAIGVLFLFYT